MSKILKLLVSMMLCVFMVFATIACDGFVESGDDDNDNNQEEQQEEQGDSGDTPEVVDTRDRTGYSLNNMIEYVYPTGFITGIASPNYSTTNKVGGTDLGFPVYDDTRDRMYYIFGDTFSDYGTDLNGDSTKYTQSYMSKDWRSQTVGYVDNYSTSNFCETRKFTGWISNNEGLAVALNEGFHTTRPNSEGTKIPTGGICIDGTFYMFYMSIQRFSNEGGKWFCSYCGAVKSTDGGATWARVYDLTWFSSAEVGKASYANFVKNNSTNEDAKTYNTFDETEYYTQILGLANMKVMNESHANGSKNKSTIDAFTANLISTYKEGTLTSVEDRIAPNFMQITPVDGKDGYIYIFGIQGGREDGMQMGRVLKENFEKFDEYEYFTGYDSSKNPTWKSYKEGGLSEIEDGIKINSLSNHDGNKTNASKNNSLNKTFILADEGVGETTVFYNPYLGKWILSGNYWNGVYYYASSKITGPYTKKALVITSSGTTEGSYYHYENHEKFDENDYDYAAIKANDVNYSSRPAFVELYGGFGHEKMCTEDGSMYMVISYMDRIYNSLLIEVKLY